MIWIFISRWADINVTFDEAIFSLDKAKNLCIAELWKYFLTQYSGNQPADAVGREESVLKVSDIFGYLLNFSSDGSFLF